MRRFLSLRLLLSLLLSWLVVLNSISANAKERVTYYHNDVQGSPVAATNAQGALLWQEDYAPYGKRLIKEGDGRNTRWFTGKSEVAALGLQYFDARWYDADLGRFLSVDPADFDDGDIHTFNRYAYANNNPYRYVDPAGETVVDAVFLAADLVKLGVAVSSGVGVGAAAVDVGLSILGVISPVPGMTLLAKAEYTARLAKSVDKALAAKEIKNARQRGVDRAKSAERELIKSGHSGTADGGGWSFAERKRIAETGQYPSDVRWHHINDVKRNPDLADVANNIIPSRGGNAGHVEKYHPGGTRAGSSGPMLNRGKMLKDHMGGN